MTPNNNTATIISTAAIWIERFCLSKADDRMARQLPKTMGNPTIQKKVLSKRSHPPSIQKSSAAVINTNERIGNNQLSQRCLLNNQNCKEKLNNITGSKNTM